jgi:pimeloyl-ACP methyl ester carboxylesterase
MPRPGIEILTLDGRRVEVQCERRPGPVIVLINGAGGPLDGWMRVWGPLTELSTVVAWNRPGIGASDPPHLDQTSEAVTRQLKALLCALAIPGPYVLVGHSLGGLHALHFAGSHPAHTAAVVLLEATAPEDVAAMAEHASALQRGLNQNAMVQLSPLGSQVRAHRSGHFPQLSEPTLVVQVIADLCRAAHSGHIA